MAFAYFYQHWPPLKGGGASFWPIANGGELAIMFCFAFLLIATNGCGHVVSRLAPAWRRTSRPASGHRRDASTRRQMRATVDDVRPRRRFMDRFRR
jgi:putative oxidoreductase